MRINELHRWDVSPKEAVGIQRELSGRVVSSGDPGGIRLVAGADASCLKFGKKIKAAVCLLSLPGMEVVEEVTFLGKLSFPYVPGLLSFREGEALLECFRRLKKKPDAVIFDGQGIAHPRRFGIAAHLGLWLGVPTIGCAKSHLYGEYEEPGREKGSFTAISSPEGEPLGACLRTREDVKPVFVSPGNGISVEAAVRIVLLSCARYRLPEPVRMAHELAKMAPDERG